jgi:hypothetical protein
VVVCRTGGERHLHLARSTLADEAWKRRQERLNR